MSGRVFVFGSNLAGRHGAGSALHAKRHHGAINGEGAGRQGDSYAIPTKNGKLATLARPAIELHVAKFLGYARSHQHLTFDVVAIGCGLAGYTPSDIAPMFRGAPPNVVLPPEFVEVIGETGT